ncbi:HNH endonuclease, partial [Escherichia coli]
MAGQTISSDCDPPRGGIIRRKKTIAPDTAPRLMQRKNSCFRPVNMLTGCPGIFSVFIFI